MSFRNKRLQMDYFRSQNLIKQNSPRFLRDAFIIFMLFFILLWLLPSPSLAILVFAISFALLIFRRYIKRKREYTRLKKACFQRVAVREYQKRLEKLAPDVLLSLLQDELSRKFEINDLKVNNGLLEGRFLGEKIAVAYLHAHGEEIVTKREVLAVLRKCLQHGFTQVRIFSNGDFVNNLWDLTHYHELNLRLYNGDKLQYLLKNTFLFPSVSQIREIISLEMSKRRQKLSLIKMEITKKKKYTGYLFYSVLLFLMAWLNLGVVYLNLIAGLILLGLALTNFLQSLRVRETELEPEIYFQREGF